MKILSIRGKNLASLEAPFELDFTVEPLLSAGIFAITGQTGSGKSTVLDALCLAFFDDTPRMSRAGENSVFVPDVRDKTINQRDSRSILRRGAGEGYAEVDFVSLGGERFRATWSVKRARGKADGALQNTEIRLVKLADGEEMQGRKTELLHKITELIGLTFDQFTRAVLLAQGDFATFLKAKQSEKAELLEKLTGTDIYSRISTTVFEKTRNAEQEYLNIKKQIQDVELLSDEQIETLRSEKKRIETENESLKTEALLLAAKIKWLADKETLTKAVVQAEKSLAETQNAIAEARPRHETIARIESVQEIRDTFNERQQVEKQLETSSENLKQKELEYNSNAENLSKAGNLHSALEEEKENIEREIADIEPVANKARTLDVQIAGAKTNADEAVQEHKAAQKAEERLEKNIRSLAGEIETAKADADKLLRWFEEHKTYRSIIPQTDLIIALLDETQTAQEQSAGNRNLQKENEDLLEKETQNRIRLQEEAERLNRLLPAEIAVLRAKLKDGTPCPVCGSVYHPMQSTNLEQSLQEEELNKAKQQVAGEIEILTDKLNQRKEEITRLAALAENYENRANMALQKVENYLSELPSWQADFKHNILQTKLKETAAQWKKNTEEAALKEGIINSNNALLHSEQNNLTEAKNNRLQKEKKKTDSEKTLEDFQKERALLLDGKPVDEVAKAYANKRKEVAEKLQKSVENKNNLTQKQDTLQGIIIQMTNETARLKTQNHVLQEAITKWMNEKEGIFTEQSLAALLSKDPQWLNAEKQFLETLKNREISDKATLTERNNNLDRHFQAEIKPSDENETGDYLLEKQSENTRQTEQGAKRKAEIELTFVNHDKGKERIGAFEKTLEEKAVLSDNWKKLNELFGSASGSKFKEMAQGYTLDALLTYANKHLQELSKRYELQRIPNTLALQVKDLDMLGDIRTVHSLSGGESFLISLALALGLSSLSSNRMRVESLFIDEGFGSLDPETLRVAMDALERLQTQGRKIGVISHVEEMTERIAARVCVTKTANGRSRVQITG